MSLFALDPEMIINVVLIACALIFIIAVALRISRGTSGEGGDGDEYIEGWTGRPAGTGASEPDLESGGDRRLTAEDGAVKPGTAEELSGVDVKELFSRIAQEEQEALISSAGTLLKHLRRREEGSEMPSEDIERMAMQFGLIELALRRVSSDQTGESCTFPVETMEEIIREGFRLVSSKPGD